MPLLTPSWIFLIVIQKQKLPQKGSTPKAWEFSPELLPLCKRQHGLVRREHWEKDVIQVLGPSPSLNQEFLHFGGIYFTL